MSNDNAKSYERLGNRLHKTQTWETVYRQKDDALHNIQRELKKEGHTGALTTPDGMVRMKPLIHKDFFIEVFGRLEYESQLVIYGTRRWIGTAEGKISIRGEDEKMIFDIETMMPHGFETDREAAQYLISLVDLYRNPKQ